MNVATQSNSTINNATNNNAANHTAPIDEQGAKVATVAQSNYVVLSVVVGIVAVAGSYLLRIDSDSSTGAMWLAFAVFVGALVGLILLPLLVLGEFNPGDTDNAYALRIQAFRYFCFSQCYNMTH